MSNYSFNNPNAKNIIKPNIYTIIGELTPKLNNIGNNAINIKDNTFTPR